MSARGLDFMRSCLSPTDWLRAAGVEIPSFACETMLDAVAAAPPTAEQRALWSRLSPHPWPITLAPGVVDQCGRGSFKSWRLIVHAIDRLVRFDNGAHVAKGTRVFAAIVAPKQAQAGEDVRVAKTILEPLCGFLGWSYKIRDEHGDAPEITIEIPDVDFEPVLLVQTADQATLRGPAYVFLGIEEAGWHASGAQSASTAHDIYVAAAARLVQFPHGLAYLASTNGPPQGLFYDWAHAPPKGVLKLGPNASWDINPAMSEARISATFADDVIDQEFRCITWGLRDAVFIRGAEAQRCIEVQPKLTMRPPRALPNAAVVTADYAPIHDAAPIAVTSRRERAIGPQKKPVSLHVVEHIEIQQGSKTRPLTTEAYAARLVKVSAAFGHAPIVFDIYGAVDLTAHLRAAGYLLVDDPRQLARKTMFQSPVTPAVQTQRWTFFRAAITSRRLFVPDTEAGREAMRQAGILTATQLASGALKVDGNPDDAAEVVQLGAYYSQFLAAVDDGEGIIEHRVDGISWGEGGLDVRARWVRRFDDGRLLPAEIPAYDPAFEDHVRDALAVGMRTPSIDRFLRSIGLDPEQPLTPDALDRARPIRSQ